MRRFFSVFVFVLIICIVSTTVSATTVNFDIAEVDEDNDIYKIVATVNQEGIGNQFNSFRTVVEFDYSIFKPVDKNTYKHVDINTTSSSKTPVRVTRYYDENSASYVESTQIQSPQWSINTDTNIAELLVEHGMLIGQDPVEALKPADLMMMEMYFTFADGKSIYDISDSSFIVRQVKYTDKFGLPDETYGCNNTSDTILVVNNVYSKLYIPVKKNDVIYFQDGTFVTATETTDEYEIPLSDGYVVVNTGYETQKFYKVSNRTITDVNGLENAILGTPGVSIRVDRYSGIRFRCAVSNIAKSLTESVDGYEIVEYGFIMTAETNKIINDVGYNYVLNMDMVNNGYAKKGVAYDANTDIVFDRDDSYTWITGVVCNIPEDAASVQTTIVARPYYKLSNGIHVYGETIKSSVHNAYQACKNDEETYFSLAESERAYIDKIVGLV